jgi:hypothetical protein
MSAVAQGGRFLIVWFPDLAVRCEPARRIARMCNMTHRQALDRLFLLALWGAALAVALVGVAGRTGGG